MENLKRLRRVCSLLNGAGAKYLVIGGFACILHGIIRTTEDVDILVEDSDDNLRKVIDGLSKMEDGAAAELTPEDFRQNLVIKIADEVEVDVSRQAWKVTYPEAIPSALHATVEGVDIPYLGMDALLASKSTYRKQDQLDAARLKELRDRPPSAQ